MRCTMAALLAFAGTACALPPGPVASAQEAAQELNLDARFGRSEIAMDHVAPRARDAFSAHHRGWGTTVRIADLDLAGARAHGDHDVDILVRVAWYRLEEQDLHTTTVKQGWNDKNGWQLVDETRIDGDVGLLGETVVFESPAVVDRAPAQFPTVRLGAPQ
jgi:hypothetical protein